MGFIKSKWKASKFEEKINQQATDIQMEPGIPLSGLVTKIIEIGDWDMTVSATKSVRHYLDYRKIRQINVMIRDDNDARYYSLLCYDDGSSLFSGGGFALDVNYVTIWRGGYNNAVFDSTNYNRGWIIILYEP